MRSAQRARQYVEERGVSSTCHGRPLDAEDLRRSSRVSVGSAFGKKHVLSSCFFSFQLDSGPLLGPLSVSCTSTGRAIVVTRMPAKVCLMPAINFTTHETTIARRTAPKTTHLANQELDLGAQVLYLLQKAPVLVIF